MLELFDVQKKHVLALQRALEKNKAAIDSSDTGTGKTVCAIETSKAMDLAPFVVSPKAVIPSWEETLRGQQADSWCVYGWEKLRAGNTPYLKRSPKGKNFVWQLDKESVLLIFDEVHKAKGKLTQNARMLMAARKQGFTILCLSATAAEDPREMRALGYALGLHKNQDFFQWAQTWGCKFDDWGQLVFDPEKKHLLAALNRIIYPARGHKMRRQDLGDKFQECQLITDPIDFGAAKLKGLAQELEDELGILRERKKEDGDDPIALTKILRLRQEIELLKIPTLVKLIENAREDNHFAIVFLNFTDSITALSRRLKEKHTFIWGHQTEAERKESIRLFQDGEVGIIICNIQAGGVGVSLHDLDGSRPRINFISPTYNAKDLKQSLGRSDRLGAKSPTVQKILVAADTIEVKIVKSLFQKIENIALLHGEINNTKPMDNTDNTQKVITEEPAHAEFGPSSMKLFKKCPGYYPKVGTNDAAESGTRIHEAVETGDWTNLSDFEHSQADWLVNAQQMVLESHGLTKYEDHPEIRLTIDLIGRNTFGTCDRLCIQGHEAVQIDYKTGVYQVEEPASNTQAKCYVIGALQKFPNIDTIHFYFLCSKRDEILYDTFTRDQLPSLIEEISSIIARAEKFRDNYCQEATVENLHPDTLLCEYCANAHRCPAIANKLIEVAKKFQPDSDHLQVPEIVRAEDTYDRGTIEAMLLLKPIVEEAFEGWKTRAKELIADGEELDFFELKTRKGKRTITNASAAWAASLSTLREKYGDDVDFDDLLGKFLEGLSSYPVGAFEDFVKACSRRGDKSGMVKEIMAALTEGDFVENRDEVVYLSRKKETENKD